MARPNQERLPGVEAEIPELEDGARLYAGFRDERMELLKREVEQKEYLLELMKKYGKEEYSHDGIEIKVVHEAETVKVKIKRETEEEATAKGLDF